MRSGTYKQPELRFYIVISPDSLVPTPEKLQEMAKMASPPRVIDTTYKGLHGGNALAPQMGSDGKPQEVRVGEVGYDGYKEITRKMDCDVAQWVLINNSPRGAILVKGFKKVEAREEAEDEGPVDTLSSDCTDK